MGGEHKLNVFENKVLKRIFGPKKDEVMGGWRKLHNEVLHDMYLSSSKIRISQSRKMRWTANVTRVGENRNVYRLLVGKPEGKKPLDRAKRRWIDNIKMDLLKMELGGVDWIGQGQDRDK
jgi:hypothetical protein